MDLAYYENKYKNSSSNDLVILRKNMKMKLFQKNLSVAEEKALKEEIEAVKIIINNRLKND